MHFITGKMRLREKLSYRGSEDAKQRRKENGEGS